MRPKTLDGMVKSSAWTEFMREMVMTKCGRNRILIVNPKPGPRKTYFPGVKNNETSEIIPYK
jgi:hypothetical protein